MSFVTEKFLGFLLNIFRESSEMMLYSRARRKMKLISLSSSCHDNLFSATSNESTELDFPAIIQLIKSILEDLRLLEHSQESPKMPFRFDVLISNVPQMALEQRNV